MGLTRLADSARVRRGFSLVELVVVILIVGILAAVAAPKMFDTASGARESATRASLGVVRDAIELFAANDPDGRYPSPNTLEQDLRPYIKGAFPMVQVGGNRNARIRSTDNVENPSGSEGWSYNPDSGEFAVNDGGLSADGVTRFSQW